MFLTIRVLSIFVSRFENLQHRSSVTFLYYLLFIEMTSNLHTQLMSKGSATLCHNFDYLGICNSFYGTNPGISAALYSFLILFLDFGMFLLCILQVAN